MARSPETPMEIRELHAWDVPPGEAVQIQEQLRARVHLGGRLKGVRYVAGADVSASRRSQRIWAGVVVMRYPGLTKVEERWAEGETTFPYIPGLLSFREIPIILEALRQIRICPDVLLCDGQGRAHPRGLGLASHLGLLVNRPTIGCAKSRLVGTFSSMGREKGDRASLIYREEVVGKVLRTRAGVKPLFVSPGNRIGMEESIRIVLHCCPKFRIPEPIRQAHLLANALRKEDGAC